MCALGLRKDARRAVALTVQARQDFHLSSLRERLLEPRSAEGCPLRRRRAELAEWALRDMCDAAGCSARLALAALTCVDHLCGRMDVPETLLQLSLVVGWFFVFFVSFFFPKMVEKKFGVSFSPVVY